MISSCQKISALSEGILLLNHIWKVWYSVQWSNYTGSRSFCQCKQK